jgi:hypothetical protein
MLVLSGVNALPSPPHGISKSQKTASRSFTISQRVQIWVKLSIRQFLACPTKARSSTLLF